MDAKGEGLSFSRSKESVLLTAFLIPVVAFLARSLPLQWSPLPYNIDGLSELRVAQDILGSGHFDFSGSASTREYYVSDMPLLALLLAFFSSFLGVSAASSAQFLTSIIGSVAVALGFLIFKQHWQSTRGGISATLLLALAGSFVFTTGCVWKETLGFVLIAIALYSYPLRDQPSHRVLLGSSLLLSIFAHHHITIVSFLIFTFAVSLDLANRPRDIKFISRKELVDIITIIIIWTVAILYYWSVDLPYLDYLSPSADLYLYLAVASLVLLVAVSMSRRERALTKLPLGLAVPAAGAVLMLYNYFHPLFPGIPGPASLIAVPFLAYLLLVIPAWEGARLALRPRGATKNLLLAMLLGPLSLIIFAFLRANDVMSHEIIFRTFDFLMPAFALLVGVGFAALVKGRERLGIVAGISLVVICASTLPVAYQTQELFGVKNQTYWFEYDAVKWFSEHGVESYTSDQRLGETGWRLFDLEYGRGLPYDLREGLALNRSSFFVLEDEWSKKGAQEFPFGVVVVDEGTIASVLSESSVFYVGGPPENNFVGFLTR